MRVDAYLGHEPQCAIKKRDSTQLMNTKYSSAKRKSSEIHQVRQLTIEKGQT